MTTQGIPARSSVERCTWVNSESTTITPERPARTTPAAQRCGSGRSAIEATTTSRSAATTPRMISMAQGLSSAEKISVTGARSAAERGAEGR